MLHRMPDWAKHWRFLLLPLLHIVFVSPLQAALLVTENSESITIHFGSGANVSRLSFVEPSLNPKPIIYAWHYDGSTNPDGSLRTGYDLFNAVAAETAGSPWALSYSTGVAGLTTSFTIGPITSRTVNPLSTPVWTYWIQGGSEYVAWGDYDDALQNYASFTFSAGNSLIVSPAYWDTRYISNGTHDVWTITPFSFTGAASDTHYYTDLTGKIQSVTFGTYEGPAPVFHRPPVVVSSRILEADQLEITFSTVEGGVYQLQEQAGLTQNGWRDFGLPFTATTAQKTYALPMNSPSKRSFFRLVRQE